MDYESERQTRKNRIDPQLNKQGWKVIPYNPVTPMSLCQNCAIEEYPTANGPADYALCVDGQILGVLEAKKISLGPQNVLTQAERYARGLINNPLNFDGFRAPFLYSTNGEVIWFHDVRSELNRSRKITQFHTPDALREMFSHNFEANCDWLAANQNNHPRLRPYQIEANAAMEQAIQKRKRDHIGSIKTAICSQHTPKTIMFQFHIGSIKTSFIVASKSRLITVSIPHWFDQDATFRV